jgi:hypothetical protein
MSLPATSADEIMARILEEGPGVPDGPMKYLTLNIPLLRETPLEDTEV